MASLVPFRVPQAGTGTRDDPWRPAGVVIGDDWIAARASDLGITTWGSDWIVVVVSGKKPSGKGVSALNLNDVKALPDAAILGVLAWAVSGSALDPALAEQLVAYLVDRGILEPVG